MGFTCAYEQGNVCVGCYFAVGDFLHGCVDGVEEGGGFVGTRHGWKGVMGILG